jgi:hypothetical protein
MKFIYALPFFIALLFTSHLALAAAPADTITYPQVKFSGQFRYRGELDGRFFNLDAKPLWFNLLRSRLAASVAINKTMSVFIQMQDARNFGESTSGVWRGTLDGSADNFDLHQGFFLWNDALVSNLALKLGRFSFGTNNERLLGALEWHNVGRSFDGALLTYTVQKWQLRAFGFALGTRELLMTAAPLQVPSALAGGDLTLPFEKTKLNFYLYHDRNNADQSAGQPTNRRKLSRYTLGGYWKGNYAWLETEFEGAYQLGSIGTPDTAIGAYMLTSYIGYKSNTATLGVGFDAYTGNNANSPQRFKSFDHLFTTIHKFYGYMDFFPFTVLPSGGVRQAIAPTNQGLLAPYIRATYQTAKWNWYLTALYFRSEQPVQLAAGETSTELGAEVDAVMTYKIQSGVSVQFGVSGFFAGQAIRATNPPRGLGNDASYWAYTMLTIDF